MTGIDPNAAVAQAVMNEVKAKVESLSQVIQNLSAQVAGMKEMITSFHLIQQHRMPKGPED